MSSSHDLARTIIDPSPTATSDYTCHVTAKGNVHAGLPLDCNFCRPFTDGCTIRREHHYPASGDPALDRCGTNEPGMSGGARPVVRRTPSLWWLYALSALIVAGLIVFAVVGLLLMVVGNLYR